MTPTDLAHKWLTETPDDRALTDVFARELLAAHARADELASRNRALVHERDRAVERASAASPQKIWPVHIRCDSCPSVVAFDPAPEEAELAAALVALRWSLEAGHRCPRCKR